MMQTLVTPLEEGCCGWVGPRIVFSNPISEAPIVIINKKASINSSTNKTTLHCVTETSNRTNNQNRNQSQTNSRSPVNF